MSGRPSEPVCCVICGKNLTPTPEQLEALRRFGNPLRREPCLLTANGLHRVDAPAAEDTCGGCGDPAYCRERGCQA